MKLKKILIAAFACSIVPQAAFAAGQTTIEIFGMQAQGATREKLRAAINKTRMVRIIELNRNFLQDFYDPSQLLHGAKELRIAYTGKGIFGYAEYSYPNPLPFTIKNTFEALTEKYGDPYSHTGNKAIWSFPQGMSITLTRYTSDEPMLVLEIMDDNNKYKVVEDTGKLRMENEKKINAIKNSAF